MLWEGVGGGDEGDCELQHSEDRGALRGRREDCEGAHTVGNYQVGVHDKGILSSEEVL